MARSWLDLPVSACVGLHISHCEKHTASSAFIQITRGLRRPRWPGLCETGLLSRSPEWARQLWWLLGANVNIIWRKWNNLMPEGIIWFECCGHDDARCPGAPTPPPTGGGTHNSQHFARSPRGCIVPPEALSHHASVEDGCTQRDSASARFTATLVAPHWRSTTARLTGE